ncbi:redoxin domain-containing protein [Luteolibacter sp. AS25]|uniref:redoxin domain-containing protein n=1 Tax=Luteolibacter sp. AS25 TaxID=3135776 RepID=UPI00398A95D1
MKSLLSITLASAFAISTSFSAEVGTEAPAFTATNTKGEEVSLADYKDKVVVLEWVNFECPFVKKHYSAKNMQKLQADYTENGVIWLSIHSSAEGKQGYYPPSELATKSTAEGSQATQVLIDSSGTVGKLYDAKVTPHMMIITKDGTLAYSGAIDSIKSADSADIDKADKLFANALDSVISDKEVVNPSNQPYGCGVKY